MTTFEDWPLEPEAFDLVFAAQSFHWMDPAAAFRENGPGLEAEMARSPYLPISPLEGTTPVDDAVRQVYAAQAPEIGSRWVGHNAREHFLEIFAAAPEYHPAQSGEYEWHADYSTGEYLDLVSTHSDHRLLPPELADLLEPRRGDRRQRRPLHGRLPCRPVLGQAPLFER